MKKFAYLALLSSSMLVTPAVLADTFTVEAPIKEVTVYKGGGAQIVRVGTLAIPAGKHTLVIKDLHEELLTSHIAPHAAIRSGNAVVSDMKLKAQPTANAASAQQQELMRKIEALEAEVSTLQDQITANDMKLNFIRGIGQSQSGQIQFSNLDALEKTLNFVGSNTTNILADTQTQKQQIQTLKKQQDALRRELKRSGPGRLDYKQAFLTVNSEIDQSIEYSFSYFVEDASWNMDVTAALDSDKEKMNLALSAEVSQRTGENWENISLSLSNTRPSSYAGSISVPSQFISIAPEDEMIRRMDLKQAPARMEASFSDAAMGRSNSVTANSSRFDRKYEVAGASSIKSNGETEKLSILNNIVDVSVVTRAAPFFGGNAYVYADTNLSDFLSVRNIDVSLSRDGNFAGTGRWPNLENGKLLELPFGEDTNIEVSYTEQAPRDGDKGFINKKAIEEKRYLISVTNNGTATAPVEIYDRYPVAAHEDIKITPLKTATKPDETGLKNKPGVLKWKKTLNPGETWYIRHEYQVTYPSNKSIRRSNR